jgi:hypothetical protein
MLANVDAVKALIGQQKNLVLAGEESLLQALPEGNWIGGTIPYFMSAEGGKTSRGDIFAVEVPKFAQSARISVYDEQTIANIGIDSPENGYTILILPAFSQLHRLFALESPRYDQQFFKVVAGWIAGTHLDDVGRAVPKVFAGPRRECLESKGLAMHVELPPEYEARLGIVNIFEQGDGQPIQFPETGFQASECIVGGKRENILDFVGRSGIDLRLPLVSDLCGTKLNVSIQSADIPGRSLKFFALVFEGGGSYRAAKPIANYAERFLTAVVPDHGHTVFACNCAMNYLHGQLEGRRAGDLLGPMTFGESAYQLLNQTRVHISVSKRL